MCCCAAFEYPATLESSSMIALRWQIFQRGNPLSTRPRPTREFCDVGGGLAHCSARRIRQLYPVTLIRRFGADEVLELLKITSDTARTEFLKHTSIRDCLEGQPERGVGASAFPVRLAVLGVFPKACWGLSCGFSLSTLSRLEGCSAIGEHYPIYTRPFSIRSTWSL